MRYKLNLNKLLLERKQKDLQLTQCQIKKRNKVGLKAQRLEQASNDELCCIKAAQIKYEQNINGYRVEGAKEKEKNTEGKSRGAIIPWLMTLGHAHDIRDAAMTNFDPHRFMSFSLIVVQHDSLDAYHWRGGGELHHESHQGEWTFFSSSSWKTDEVIAWRRRAFDDWRNGGHATTGALPSLHVLHPDGKHEWSPLMDRERTCTRSITQIDIAPPRIEAIMRYWRRDTLDAGDQPVVSTLPLRNACNDSVHG